MRRRFYRLSAFAIFLVACAGVGPVPTPQLPPGPTAAGFDTRNYPGAEAMQAWRKNSPYSWVGYYLPAPCYTGTSWVGKRTELEAQGWGTAVLFVGEQDWRAMGRADTAGVATQNPRCTASNLTEANGRLHAQAADSTAQADGFENRRIIFLDVERVDSVSAELRAYVQGWTAQLLANGRYTPGLYTHERNATALMTIMQQQFSAARRNSRLAVWVAKSTTMFTPESNPEMSGIAGAAIWQGILNRQEVWGGVTLTIDVNAAVTDFPGLLAGPNQRNRMR